MVKPLVPPMVDILGPYTSTPEHALARPGRAGDAAGAGFSWLKDCTDDNAEDGTPLTAEHINNYKAQFLTLFQASGIPIDDLDEMLAYAVQSGRMNFAVAGGSANAWSIDPALAIPAYAAGRVLWVKAPGTNTSTTVYANTSGRGNRLVKKADGSDPVVGDLVAGRWYPTLDDGTAICVIAPLPSEIRAASFLTTRVIVTATGGGTFVVPAGVYRIRVSAWGAGGGGGYSTVGAASGGGSGAYVQRSFDVSPGDVVSFSVGAGGLGGAGSPARAGQPGDATTVTVNGTTITAGGGGGGLNGTTTNGSANSPNGGAAVGGDINLAGSNGDYGYVVYGPAILGGNGSASPNGGQRVMGGAGASANGRVPGGGASASGGASYVGGTGARGEVWLEY
ncbi:hypothetical protein ABE438_17350 [Bosea sp. TWI1241]|uniref:glycine-rich domain-containing protein n=1 Tax=Bosea sp. TWI1241 TaxID=3148904 RepID=UPI003207B915